MPALTLAHSPDPDDVFMWWPITGKIDPGDPERIVEPPVLDTGRFTFRGLPADIDVLNRRAIERGDLDITALSIFAWATVSDRYALTCCGSSFGEGYGPKLVARGRTSLADLAGASIAVPGVRTTAYLLLTLALGKGAFEPVEMGFDKVLGAVASGHVDAGLLIHQSQLTFAEMGLCEVVDLGRWWGDRTGLPLPLGGNAINRTLEARYGEGTLGEITGILSRSIRHARSHVEQSTRYAMQFAPEISREQADRYIEMYVSDLTVDAGERGERAIRRMLSEAASFALCPEVPDVRLLRAR